MCAARISIRREFAGGRSGWSRRSARQGSGVAGRSIAGPWPAARAFRIRDKIARRMRESLATTAQYTLNASADAGGSAHGARAGSRPRRAAGYQHQRPGRVLHDQGAAADAGAQRRVSSTARSSSTRKFTSGSRAIRRAACWCRWCETRTRSRSANWRVRIEGPDGAAQSQGRSRRTICRARRSPISNLGGLGIESFTPLLNPPQVAILGVGAIQLKPVRQQTGRSSSSTRSGYRSPATIR